MRKNFTTKLLLIIGVLLVFIYGIFGIPHGVSGSAWKQAVGSRIHLGLDLSGGTHLVLQVMVEEAMSAVTDNDVARIEADLQAAGIQASTVGKTEPATAGHYPRGRGVSG